MNIPINTHKARFQECINAAREHIKSVYTAQDLREIYDQFDNFVIDLESRDFNSLTIWSCPASSAYHHCYEGGWMEHCLEVYDNLFRLSWQGEDHPGMGTTINPLAAFILAFGHDITKLWEYEIYFKNVKDDATGLWNKVQDYRKIDDTDGLGHGSAAAMHCLRCFPWLGNDILSALMWHMGAFVEPSQFSNACNHHPLVLMMHTADMMSSTGNYSIWRKVMKGRGR